MGNNILIKYILLEFIKSLTGHYCYFISKTMAAAFFIFLVYSYAFVESDVPKIEKEIELYNKGQYEEALKEFKDSHVIDSEKSKLKYNLANAFYSTGKFEYAVKAYFDAGRKLQQH